MTSLSGDLPRTPSESSTIRSTQRETRRDTEKGRRTRGVPRPPTDREPGPRLQQADNMYLLVVRRPVLKPFPAAVLFSSRVVHLSRAPHTTHHTQPSLLPPLDTQKESINHHNNTQNAGRTQTTDTDRHRQTQRQKDGQASTRKTDRQKLKNSSKTTKTFMDSIPQ